MTLTQMSLEEACAALAAGRTSSVELLDALLAEARRLDPVIHAVAEWDEDAARAQAAQRDQERQRGQVRGPLHGVPLAHKDLFFRPGRAPLCGSRVPVPAQARLAGVLARLEGAGAVDLGSVQLSEFAYNPTGHNWAHGHVRNPWHLEHVTGGSSSGSAASVAACFNFASIGSDTAASIRVPAACCGVTGLKPTHGLVDASGCVPLSYSLDTLGPIARSARDCGLMLDALAGTQTLRAANDLPAGLRVGVATRYFVDDIDAEVARGLDDALATLRELGARVVPVAPAGLPQANANASVIIMSEATSAHRPLMAPHADRYSPTVLERLEQGARFSAEDYVGAQRYRALALAEFSDSVFAQADVLVAPVMAMPVPRLDDVGAESDPAMNRIARDMTRLTRPINYLGLPALSLPVGRDRRGLPLAVQLIGRPHSEALLIQLGAALQRITDWHLQRPPITLNGATPGAGNHPA
ncbi:MAG: amidase [Hydrogenophaga sp.]|uniref:amidase n=1 Tax=Hydrogenophaga sp. TaxID=1904254 RepID=UPI0025BDB3F2|nr:amidase [Hydrogenophaga sp.]MBU7575191.1 amidase [Hydrogenophaga sp.]